MIAITKSSKYTNLLVFKFDNFNLEYPEEIKDIIKYCDHNGDYKKIKYLNTLGNSKYKYIYILGLGSTEEFNNIKLFNALGNFIRTVKNDIEDLDILENFNEDLGYTLGEAIMTSIYKYEGIKQNKEEIKLKNINIITEFKESTLKGIEITNSINKARDLIHMPSNKVTPKYFTYIAQSLAKDNNIDIEILDKFTLEHLGMGGILSVAKGSIESPYLIVMQYFGDEESKDIYALVGKGVTFDSGGLTLKPGKGMEKMINDMSGAAVVLSVIDAIAKIKPKKNVIALIPLVENMPSSKAYKPGDVITTYSGKTVEIISADAEGRVVLCDAITYAKELGANYIIDIATLTGSCANFLGDINVGLFSNSNELAYMLTKSGKEIGENLWRLPNNPEYLEQLKTNNADLKNSGSNCGGIVASKFLECFAEDVSFAHLDIAGMATYKSPRDAYEEGANGIPARTLINFLTK